MADETDFDVDIAKMEKIAEVVKKFDKTDVQLRVLDALVARAFHAPISTNGQGTAGRSDPERFGIPLVDLDSNGGTGNGAESGTPENMSTGASSSQKPAKKSTRRPKAQLTVPRDINFAPHGKQSLRDYATEKNPTTKMERALLAVHYLSEVLNRRVQPGEVVAVFRYLDWENPANPVNNLQKCQTEGWLNTTNLEDIKVVFGGEEYLRTKLPKPAKKA